MRRLTDWPAFSLTGRSITLSHAAAQFCSSSYAHMIMVIHFLQRKHIVPNLQVATGRYA